MMRTVAPSFPGWILCLLLLSALLVPTLGLAQEQGETNGKVVRPERGFYDGARLQDILQQAQRFGVDESILRRLAIIDGDQVIEAWDYLRQQRAEREARAARQARWRSRVYRTPQDIFRVLRSEEEASMRILRSQLPFLEAALGKSPR